MSETPERCFKCPMYRKADKIITWDWCDAHSTCNTHMECFVVESYCDKPYWIDNL